MWRPFKKTASAPTPHHYVLAHVALRQVCFDDPLHFFGIMASPDRDEFLKWVWGQVRESCDEEGKANFSIRDLKISTRRCQDHPALIIRMPPPRETAHAHMIGVVLELSEDQDPGYERVHYFTLERGMAVEGHARTVLCAWDSSGTHTNLGGGPSVDEDAFLAALADHLYSSSSTAASEEE